MRTSLVLDISLVAGFADWEAVAAGLKPFTISQPPRTIPLRSIASTVLEQRETKVLFGVMFSLLGGRNRARLKVCLGKCCGGRTVPRGENDNRSA
jgi:hypothetical protein